MQIYREVNMADSEQDLASLISKIEQLEERQNITAKYSVGVKRQLDELTEKFNNRQHRFDQQAALSSDLNGNKPTNGLVAIASAAVESLTDGVESIMLNNSTDVMLITPVEVNVDGDEIDRDEIDVAAKQERNVTAFSDEEFKRSRMTQLLGAYGDWLLLKAYLAEEKSQDTPVIAEEFWRRIKQGELDFTGVNLAGVNLSGRQLTTVNLSKANLSGANLSRINGANLKDANLDGAILKNANLSGAIMPDGTTHE